MLQPSGKAFLIIGSVLFLLLHNLSTSHNNSHYFKFSVYFQKFQYISLFEIRLAAEQVSTIVI